MTSSPFAALKIRDYRHFFIARTSMVMGVNIVGTAVGWQVYEITKDAFSLGMIGLAEFVPFLIVTLLGGYVADIFDRRKIILTCVALYSVCTLGLYLLSSDFSYIVDNQGVVPIFVLIGAIGLVRGFFGPAQSAFASQLIPQEVFTNAATWTTMGWQLSAVGGPAIGGLLCAFSKGAWSSYLVAVILAVIGLLFFLTIESRHEKPVKIASKPVDTEGSKLNDFLLSVKLGLNFVFKNQIILGALA